MLPTRAPHEVNLLAGKRAVVARPMRDCHCGGGVYLDFFNPIKRPVEWFMRCRKCDGTTNTFSTEAEAMRNWTAGAALIKQVARSARGSANTNARSPFSRRQLSSIRITGRRS